MAPTRSDSPVSRRIVRSFLEFLRNVQFAPGTDCGGLKLARECLMNVFEVDTVSPTDEFSGLELLVDFVESLQTGVEANSSGPSAHQGEHPTRRSFAVGSFKDEAFRRFQDSLQDKDILAIDYRLLSPLVPIKKTNELIREAIDELEDSGCSEFNNENVAESLKSLGNRAMESKKMFDAIQLYTCAIALCTDNPVYYANRAAAFIEINEYDQAIEDCLTATDCDPNYWKAYSRLGAAHFALGRYNMAILWFEKALALKPDNASLKKKVRLVEQKLLHELLAKEQNQNQGLNMSGATNGSQQLSQNESGGGRVIAGVNIDEGTPQNSSQVRSRTEAFTTESRLFPVANPEDSDHLAEVSPMNLSSASGSSSTN